MVDRTVEARIDTVDLKRNKAAGYGSLPLVGAASRHSGHVHSVLLRRFVGMSSAFQSYDDPEKALAMLRRRRMRHPPGASATALFDTQALERSGSEPEGKQPLRGPWGPYFAAPHRPFG